MPDRRDDVMVDHEGVCGRYAAAKDPAALAVEFDVTTDLPSPVGPDYNVAPTKQAMIVVERTIDDQPARTLEVARWGLIPSWAKDPSIASRMINARAETVAEKPAYRSAFAKRRCLVPADGFYEWYQASDKRKQPFFIRRSDERSLAMAGLYEWWRGPQGGDDWRLTFTVITTQATDSVGQIHDRMPMTIPAAQWSAWLDPAVGSAMAQELMVPADADALEAFPVSTRVNNVRNNGPDLIVPVEFDEGLGE